MNRNYRHRYSVGQQFGQLAVGTTDGRLAVTYSFKDMKRISRNVSVPEPGGTLAAWAGDAEEPVWKTDLPGPFQVESMVLAGDVLLIAGPADKFRRESGGVIRMLSAKDGKAVGGLRLEAAPVAEGLAVAGGRLYVSTYGGKLVCFGDGSRE